MSADKQVQYGFSLPEVMIGLMIVLLLLITTYSIFILSQQTQRRVDDRAEVVQNQRAMLDRMTRELRQANAIVTSLPAAEIIFEDGHGNLENSPLQYIRYYLQGTDLYRQVRYYYFAGDPSTHVKHNDTDGGGNPPLINIVEDRLVGEYTTSLGFSGSGTITISISFSQNNQTVTLTADVTPRNLN